MALLSARSASVCAFAFGITSALSATAHADVYCAPAAVPVVATCDWGGAYVGVDTGLAVSRTRWGFPQTDPEDGNGRVRYFDYTAGDHFRTDERGWVGSVHGGYNFRTNSPIVAGVELSYTGGDLEKRQTSRFDPNDSFKTEINHLIEVKGRLGYSWGCLMTYGKFGYATGRVETSAVGLTNQALPIVGASSSDWRQGYTVGGGVEYMLSRNVVLGLEYDWINLRSGTDSTQILFATTGVRSGSTLTRDIDADTHLFVARLSFKFGSAAYAPLK
jgi:outer membrane immunogenic protein